MLHVPFIFKIKWCFIVAISVLWRVHCIPAACRWVDNGLRHLNVLLCWQSWCLVCLIYVFCRWIHTQWVDIKCHDPQAVERRLSSTNAIRHTEQHLGAKVIWSEASTHQNLLVDLTMLPQTLFKRPLLRGAQERERDRIEGRMEWKGTWRVGRKGCGGKWEGGREGRGNRKEYNFLLFMSWDNSFKFFVKCN